jgi:5-methylcytosine-specific restriction endonuclease McrA
MRGQFVEDVDRLVLLELHDGVCGICGEDVDPFSYHVDHVVPLVQGGFHNYVNTQPAHPRCNLRKARLERTEVSV